MNRNTATVALVLAALTLSACDDHDGRRANGKICIDFKTTAATTAATPSGAGADAAVPVDECVRRWAYSLAPSSDSADEVTEAVVAACGPALSRWNQQSLTQPAADEDAISITTGQPTNPLAEHNAFARGRALLYVVQARAGRCAPPPATNGTPAGL